MFWKHLYVSLILVLLSLCCHTNLYAQWGSPYSNSWLGDLNKQNFVKILVKQDGIYRIPISILPASFSKNDPTKFQLWHRGKEVAIISASSTEIVFYGVKNDGQSDELLYRNSSFEMDTKARSNPYFSIYSDQSAYFLTVSETNLPSRIKSVTKPFDPSLVSIKYHLQTDIRTFADQDSYSQENNFFTLTMIQSFLEGGKGVTSKIYGKNATLTHPLLFGDPEFIFQFENLVKDTGQNPIVDLLIYGRTNTNNDISVQVGKNATSLRTLSGNLTPMGFTESRKQWEIISDTDISVDDSFTFKLFSNKIASDWNSVGMYSVTYYKIEYPQAIDMLGSKSKIFTLIPTNEVVSRVSITNPTSGALIYDITNSDNPILLAGSIVNGTLEVNVPRSKDQKLTLFVTSEINEVTIDKVEPVNMPYIEPSDYDYLILTTDKLYDTALEYSAYRKSPEGNSYKPFVIRIGDVYNQFNYGEPSPVAIRRFVDYMLSKGVKPTHNLLLLGNSISYGDSTVKNKELKNQIPTMGYPGSDILLVSGLAGTKINVPAIPVGRISATSVHQVRNYLDKVKSYEQDSNNNIEWKKRVLHLSGGKSASEITQLKNALESLVPLVEYGAVGGSVKAFQKQSIIEVEKVNITPELNDGVGMISYFGHGNPVVTDLDMGYVSDVTRGYHNINKYPLMYFNGCGVGNIFKGNTNEDLTSSMREPLSADWLCAKEKGAIAVIANSYYTFLQSSSIYLRELYLHVFNDTQRSNLSIGQIQKKIAEKITSGTYNAYDLSNLHQSVLQGDPSMHLISEKLPDYKIDPNTGITIRSESDLKTIGKSDQLRIDVAISNLGRNENIVLPVTVKYIYTDGSVDIKNENIGQMSFSDTLHLSIQNLKPLARISVQLDPLNNIQEINEKNNDAELLIEWSEVIDKFIFPNQSINDIIPPILSVTFNKEILKNGDKIKANSSIEINLTDNYTLLRDTTFVDISLKLCGDNSCNFKRVSYSSSQLKLGLISNNSLEIKFTPSGLIPGDYELLVSSKDLSGNSIIQPYRILFKVSDIETRHVLVTASPNPASDYIRFELTEDLDSDLESVNYLILDTRGNVIEQKDITNGSRSWYWIPQQKSGLYLYQLTLNYKNRKPVLVNGKVVLIK
jgi:hypothetical protein